jgi:hypothetical protein
MWGSATCSSPLLWCAQSTPPPHCISFSVPCLLLNFFFFFCRAGFSLSRGLCWFIPGTAVGIPHAIYLLTCWSASSKQVWSWHLAVQEPSYSMENVCMGWGFRVLYIWFFLFFFMPSVAPASRQNFLFTELMLSASDL